MLVCLMLLQPARGDSHKPIRISWLRGRRVRRRHFASADSVDNPDPVGEVTTIQTARKPTQIQTGLSLFATVAIVAMRFEKSVNGRSFIGRQTDTGQHAKHQGQAANIHETTDVRYAKAGGKFWSPTQNDTRRVGASFCGDYGAFSVWGCRLHMPRRWFKGEAFYRREQQNSICLLFGDSTPCIPSESTILPLTESFLPILVRHNLEL